MDIDFASIRARYPLREVAARYIEVVKRGSTWKAVCPFHDDHKPSLNFYAGSDGYDRYRCFVCDAGIGGGDVIDFVAQINGVGTLEAVKILTGGDLPEVGTFKPQPGRDDSDLWTPIVPVPDDAPDYDPARTFKPDTNEFKDWKPTRLTAYMDEEGRVLCYVARLEFANGDKICPTVTYCHGPGDRFEWCAKRMPPPFPLLGLDLLAERPDHYVLLVEGEKCWEYAQEQPELDGFVPVSWLGGVNSVKHVDFSPLRGRGVLFHSDNDEEGIKAMLEIYNLIEKAGTG